MDGQAVPSGGEGSILLQLLDLGRDPLVTILSKLNAADRGSCRSACRGLQQLANCAETALRFEGAAALGSHRPTASGFPSVRSLTLAPPFQSVELLASCAGLAPQLRSIRVLAWWLECHQLTHLLLCARWVELGGAARAFLRTGCWRRPPFVRARTRPHACTRPPPISPAHSSHAQWLLPPVDHAWMH